jgi:hypothetical protein
MTAKAPLVFVTHVAKNEANEDFAPGLSGKQQCLVDRGTYLIIVLPLGVDQRLMHATTAYIFS